MKDKEERQGSGEIVRGLSIHILYYPAGYSSKLQWEADGRALEHYKDTVRKLFFFISISTLYDQGS